MKSIRIRNASWAYEERGSGEPIVFVHGFPLDRRIWDEQLAGLADRFRVIAVDLKGFGKSYSTEAFTMDSMADDLAEFIKAIDAAPCVLASLSMGGYVAWSLALRHPEVLRKLVIVCSKAEGDSEQGKELRQEMAQLAQEHGALAVAEQMLPKMFAKETYCKRPELVAKLNDIMKACPPATISNACFAMRDRADRTGDLPKLTMPVLILLGENDSIIPVDMGRRMASACRQGALKLIASAGHLAPMEEPAAVNMFIAEFARL